MPLAWSPGFADWFTSVKWHVLHLLAAAWLLVELWVCGSGRWPAFVRERWPVVLILAGLATWSLFRDGPGWAMAPLADRLACAVLALCSCWYFTRNGGRTTAVVAGVAMAAAVTIGAGLVQSMWIRAEMPIPGADGPAAFFGNVNMAAQFTGLALVALLAAPPGTFARRWEGAWKVARVLLGATGAVYLYVLSTRSVLVALAVAALCIASARRAALAAAGLTLAILAVSLARPGAGLDPTLGGRKAESVSHRLALWSDTVDMIRDRPLGVGPGDFEHAILAYQARGRLEPQETLAFKSPHNEYLRFAAEDGVLLAVIAFALLVLLAVAWRRADGAAPGLRVLVAGWAAFLAVEAAFQFPLALAFGALAAAVAVGAALAVVEPVAAAPETRGRRWWLALGSLAAAILVATSLRVAASERTFVASGEDRGGQGRACALDPRNLPACITAAWLDARSGDPRAARARLHRVLRDAPAYPPALRLLGQMALAEGNMPEACRQLAAYDALYRERSSLHAQATAACAAHESAPGR